MDQIDVTVPHLIPFRLHWYHNITLKGQLVNSEIVLNCQFKIVKIHIIPVQTYAIREPIANDRHYVNNVLQLRTVVVERCIQGHSKTLRCNHNLLALLLVFPEFINHHFLKRANSSPSKYHNRHMVATWPSKYNLFLIEFKFFTRNFMRRRYRCKIVSPNKRTKSLQMFSWNCPWMLWKI